jgi:hypothetical protein
LPTDSFCNELKWLPYTPLLPNNFIILTILVVPYMMGKIGPLCLKILLMIFSIFGEPICLIGEVAG